MNCVAYEPFSDPNYPKNVAQALEDTLNAVVRQGFKCIKTYYSEYYGLKIAEYASRKGLYTVIGIIAFGQSWTENQIQSAIQSCLADQKVLAIYAGNEMPNSANDILYVKQRIKSAGCNVPFGTVQTIGDFLNNNNVINMVDQMDWLGYNLYPFFSKLGASTSQDMLRIQILQMKNKYGARFSKFIITETGWPTEGGSSSQGNPSTLQKAKEYADYFASMLCSGEINTKWVSYFTFFDPTYKTNVPEFERHFGLVYYNNGYQSKWNIGNLHC